MKAITYRVTPEKNEKVYRDITIREDQTFEDLHYAILDAFEINPGEMASFFLSNEDWEKGVEITLFDMAAKEHEVVNLLMANIPISKAIKEKVDHLVYVYDFLSYKTFLVSKVGEKKALASELYPICLGAEGEFDEENDEFDSEFEDDYDSHTDDNDDEFARSKYDSDDDFNPESDEDFTFESDNFDNIDDHDL